MAYHTRDLLECQPQFKTVVDDIFAVDHIGSLHRLYFLVAVYEPPK